MSAAAPTKYRQKSRVPTVQHEGHATQQVRREVWIVDATVVAYTHTCGKRPSALQPRDSSHCRARNAFHPSRFNRLMIPPARARRAKSVRYLQYVCMRTTKKNRRRQVDRNHRFPQFWVVQGHDNRRLFFISGRALPFRSSTATTNNNASTTHTMVH